MELRIHATLTCNVVEHREYLQHGLAINSGDTVLDIGGKIGTFAVLAATLGARVISVEPARPRAMHARLVESGLSVAPHERFAG